MSDFLKSSCLELIIFMVLFTTFNLYELKVDRDVEIAEIAYKTELAKYNSQNTSDLTQIIKEE